MSEEVEASWPCRDVSCHCLGHVIVPAVRLENERLKAEIERLKGYLEAFIICEECGHDTGDVDDLGCTWTSELPGSYPQVSPTIIECECKTHKERSKSRSLPTRTERKA
jgi:hypothetical protein